MRPLLPFLLSSFCTLVSLFLSQAGVSEASLHFMYKNDEGVWTAPTSSTIDVSANFVTATTTHFSEWGVFGDVMLPITANREATFTIKDGTKLVIKGSADANVSLLDPL